MEQWEAAEKAYSTALLLDPSIRRSKSFKVALISFSKLWMMHELPLVCRNFVFCSYIMCIIQARVAKLQEKLVALNTSS